MQAAVKPQNELAAGTSGQPESIHACALLVQVLERANLQRAPAPTAFCEKSLVT
jgi:hypothetical protein